MALQILTVQNFLEGTNQLGSMGTGDLAAGKLYGSGLVVACLKLCAGDCVSLGHAISSSETAEAAHIVMTATFSPL